MPRFTMRLPSDRKFRMLQVKQLLESETDANHSLTMTQIMEMLGQEKDSDRRAIYDDVKDLSELGTVVKIDKSKTPPRLNVVKRTFSLSELKLMIDAIASSKFLTKSASQALIDKLKMFCSHYEAEELNRQALLANRAKRIDTDYHDNVSKISKAIDNDRRASFQYFRINVRNKRENNKNLSLVSPWVMLYEEDNYYLMGYDGKKMRYYRLDRMDDVKILEEKREGEEEYKKIKDELPFRTQSSFNLFGGEKEWVTLRCPTYFYYVIVDKFGPNLHPMIEKGTDTFTVSVPVAVGDPFFAWVISMRNKIEIVEPKNVRDKMRELLNDVGKHYR